MVVEALLKVAALYQQLFLDSLLSRDLINATNLRHESSGYCSVEVVA